MVAPMTIHWSYGLAWRWRHASFDLPMVLAGGAQGQIKQFSFIKFKSGTLNSNLWLSLSNLMGLEIDSFADSTGLLSELWT